MVAKHLPRQTIEPTQTFNFWLDFYLVTSMEFFGKSLKVSLTVTQISDKDPPTMTKVLNGQLLSLEDNGNSKLGIQTQTGIFGEGVLYYHNLIRNKFAHFG